MKKNKPAATQQALDLPQGFRVSRPRMPAEYGIPKSAEGLLPWSHVNARMSTSLHYWICTVSPGRRPHATPVDGLWFDQRLYFGGSPQTRWNRNLVENSAVCIHLESGSEVVMLQGEAHLVIPEHEFAARLAEGSAQKYGYAPNPELYMPGVYVFQPSMVFAWTHFPQDVTRWIIAEGE